MADYTSALTGAQMDSALSDLNNHTTLYGAEAWAKGTKGGAEVPSTDAAYHNNAKYYAELAESAVPSGTSGAVLWSEAQSLDSASKAQARTNIDAVGTARTVNGQALSADVVVGSNRNLLDNGWFTVNQRGITSLAGSGYFVDRWTAQSSPSITVGSNGVTFSQTLDSVIQLVSAEELNQLDGKTMTASILLADGTLYTGTAVIDVSASNNTLISIDATGKIGYMIAAFSAASSYQIARIDVRTEVTVRAIKLEYGSVSTLLNDIMPNYAEELAKCQRYFQRIKAKAASHEYAIGYVQSATAAVFMIPLPVEMRTVPTVTFSGSWVVTSTSAVAATGIASGASTTEKTLCVATTVASGQTKKYAAKLQDGGSGDSYIDLSADL